MELKNKIETKSSMIGIIGLGYVGLPLGLAFAAKDFDVLGFDLDENKINLLKEGKGYLKHIDEEKIKSAVSSEKLIATSDFSRLPEVDAIIICVPTTLTEHREQDMSYVKNTAKTVADRKSVV